MSPESLIWARSKPRGN